MVPYQNQFRQAEAQYIADLRQREAQKISDFENFRQNQREQKFWDERADYVKRVTTPPKALRPEPHVHVSRQATVFTPDDSQPEAKRKSRPSLCLSHGALEFMERWIGWSVTFVLWAYVVLVAVPAICTPEQNRGFVEFGVSHGVPANVALVVVYVVEFLFLCWIARLAAEAVAMAVTGVTDWVFDMLDFVFGPVLRLVAWMRED